LPSFPLLDIAIGLTFVFLLLSLICSSLNEGLESLLRNRANDLERAIRKLLGDEPGSWWASFLPWVNSIQKQSITREFYQHPLIRNLFRTEMRLPNYIPSRSFALAVMDIACPDGALVRGATTGHGTANSASVEFIDEVNNVPLPDHLKNSIKTLVMAADGDARQARLNIETWFNSSMDRVSGWYKSRTQKILFCFGVVITLAVNADAISIFRNLSHSKNLQAVVGAAQQVAAQTPPGQNLPGQISDAINQLTGLDVGIGWAREVDQHGTLDTTKLPPSLNSSSCKMETEPCEHPIRWSFHLLYIHGIGWLITAAAMMLGAPFWFDTLNRFIVVRSTVKPQEKSQEEGSKDSATKP